MGFVRSSLAVSMFKNISTQSPHCRSCGGQVFLADLVLQGVQNFDLWTGDSAEHKLGFKSLCPVYLPVGTRHVLCAQVGAVTVLALLRTES